MGKERPISDVIAVQFIDGGWHTPTRQGSDPPSAPYFTYQVNLVLDDEDEPRVNLTYHSNWQASWETAAGLAEFLDVPLFDEASEEQCETSES